MDVRALTATHPLPDGEVRLLGAWKSVTGSMTRVETGGARLLVDCGVGQGAEAASFRLSEEAFDVDAVILTHGHTDHVGSLPALVARGFDRPIFGTRATLDIAELSLADGMRLEGASDAQVRRFVDRFRRLSEAVKYDRPTGAPGFRGTFCLREAGHILGSSSVEIVSSGSRVIVSGDLGRPDTPLLRDFNETWDADRPVDLVVMETTYGDRTHDHTHADVEQQLERIVRRAVQDGGHILVPAFAIGRVQTLLYHLNTLVEARRVPNILVAVDTPMGLEVTELYEQSRHLFDDDAREKLRHGDDPLEFRDLYAVRKGRDSVRLRDVKDPVLIIAGSGMCNGGRIVGHLVELLPRRETCVVFVGYQAPGTPGRRILDAAGTGERVWLGGEDVPVRASIERLQGLSAHADQHELWRWLKAIPNVRAVALHHGEPDAQAAMKRYIEAQQ